MKSTRQSEMEESMTMPDSLIQQQSMVTRVDQKILQYSVNGKNELTSAAIQKATYSAHDTLWANPAVKRFLAERRNISVIVVGANDGAIGKSNDPVIDSLNRSNVKALMVEPNPPVFKSLLENLKTFQESARLQPLNVAVCPERKTLPFYVVSPNFAKKFPSAPHWAKYELSSGNKTQVAKHWAYLDGMFKKQEEFESFIDEIQVPCWTPSDVMAIDNFKPQQVDVLMVDVEGFDAKIVTAFMSQKSFNPRIIMFEHTHLSGAELGTVQTLLQSRGYTLQKQDDANTIAWK